MIHLKKGAYSYAPNSKAFFCWDWDPKKLSIYSRIAPMKNIGDMIEMKLQITSNDSILSYKMNDDDNKFIVNDILKENGLNYCLAISISGKHRSLQLI